VYVKVSLIKGIQVTLCEWEHNAEVNEIPLSFE
jgi:hypothetical protein